MTDLFKEMHQERMASEENVEKVNVDSIDIPQDKQTPPPPVEEVPQEEEPVVEEHAPEVE